MDAEPRRSNTTAPEQVYFRGAFVCFLVALILITIPAFGSTDVYPRWLDGATLTTSFGIVILSLIGSAACVGKRCFRLAVIEMLWSVFLFAIVMFWTLFWMPFDDEL